MDKNPCDGGCRNFFFKLRLFEGDGQENLTLFGWTVQLLVSAFQQLPLGPTKLNLS